MEQLGIDAGRHVVSENILGTLDHRFQHRIRDLGRRELVHFNFPRHFRVDGTGINADDLGSLGTEFRPDPLDHRVNRCFGGAIRSQRRRRHQSANGRYDGHRAAAIGFEDRGEGPCHGQGAEVIDLHLGPGAIQIRSGDDAGKTGDARIVDQQVHFARLLGYGFNVGVVGDIQGQRHDAPGVGGDRTGQGFRVACRCVHPLGAAIQQGLTKSLADAASTGCRHQAERQ